MHELLYKEKGYKQDKHVFKLEEQFLQFRTRQFTQLPFTIVFPKK